MKEIINDCVDCGKPCLGKLCDYRNVAVYYCDRCNRLIQGEPKPYEHMELCEVCYDDLRGEEI